MFNRREFLQLVSSSIAALALPIKVVEVENVVEPKEVETTVDYHHPDGIEIHQGTQNPDSDYLECMLIWWYKDKIYGRQSLRWTSHTLKMTNYQQLINKQILEAYTNFKRQTDAWLIWDGSEPLPYL